MCMPLCNLYFLLIVYIHTYSFPLQFSFRVQEKTEISVWNSTQLCSSWMWHRIVYQCQNTEDHSL
jgi:hypothetical protein